MGSPDFTKRTINFLEDESRPDKQSAGFTESKRAKKSRPVQDNSIARRPSYKKPKRNKRKKFSYFFIFLIIILSLSGKILSAGNDGFLSGIKHSYLLRQIVNIIAPSEKYLNGEQEDRINFLLLGMGGAGHNGPYLTDTIMLASFKPSTKQASVISIPRDMIVPIDSHNYRKINSVYTIGKNNGQGGGEFTKQVVSETLGVPIHYFVAVDFAGFIEIINAIDGVKVTVDRSFVDKQFPTADYKYQEVSFTTGEQKMDGLTALRFARSRHGNNGEGSDFARSKRQQKILAAVKDKITSFNTLINPKKITSLFSIVNQYTQTDMEPWEAVKLVHMVKGLDSQKIDIQSIDNRPGGFLKAGISLAGAYILQPVTGNFEQIQQLANNIFDISEVSNEDANIVIQNGTDVPGLALKAVNYLSYMNYQVLRYGNAAEQDKTQTIIYDYTKQKPKTKKTLESIFSVKVLDNPPIEYSSSAVTTNWDIRNENNELAQLDFLIILGSDQSIDENIEIITTIDPALLNTSTPTTTDKEI
ncbi:LCP family protein [bacterium]|nr:LCP family protein [bacterium]MBT4648797.1 LCP family protein [bacterium]